MEAEAEREREARLLKELAEIKYKDSNLKSALKYIERAHRLHPNLNGLSQMLISFKILRASADSPNDWYKILQLDPFTHINAIKKQYKKLALTLHPDKNPHSGSDEAFKLVSDAFRVLSDKILRKEYDSKLKIQIQNEKMGEMEVSVENQTFWTACSTCRLLHQFEKRYLGHNLVCPSCRKSFKAVKVASNECREKTVILRNLNSMRNCSNFEGLKDSGSKQKVGAGESKEKRKELNEKTGSAGGEVRNGDLEVEIDSDDGVWSGRRLRSMSMKKKKMSSVGEVLDRSKPNPSVKIEEEMMTLAEMKSQLIQKARDEKMKLKLKEEEEEERENKRKKRVEEERQNLKKMGHLGISRQGASKRSSFYEIVKHKNSRKNTDLEMEKNIDSSNGGDSDMMVVEDSDFYDFDKDRLEKSFKKGQVWAVYDDDDGMPRHYGLIEEVTANPFEVKMSWLDLQNNGEEKLFSWEKMGFHVSCGRFKVDKRTCIDSLNIFSHIVDCERAAREIYRIYPKKGSVWALYKEEEEEEASGVDKQSISGKNKRTYDIAVFLTTYSEMHGLSMAYLDKVDGYKTIFKRREIGYQAIRWFEKDDIRLFSHQIPARKLCADEAIGHLKDCWELDPASLPQDLLTTCCNR